VKHLWIVNSFTWSVYYKAAVDIHAVEFICAVLRMHWLYV